MDTLCFEGRIEVVSPDQANTSFVIETHNGQLRIVFPHWKSAWRVRTLRQVFRTLQQMPILSDRRLDVTMPLMLGKNQLGELQFRRGTIDFKPFYLKWLF